MIKIKAVNLPKWIAEGERAAKQLRNSKLTTKIEKFLAKEFYDIEKRLFISEGGSGKDGKWQDLDEKYRARKRRLGLPARILRSNGDLRTSLIRRGGKNISKIRPSTRGFRYEFGSDDKKAEWHFFGDGDLPVRKPINPRRQQLNRIGKRMTIFAEDGLRKVKFFDQKAKRSRTGRFIRFDQVGEAVRS